MICKCKKPAIIRQVMKENQNHGRYFYCCAKSTCTYFHWAEPPDQRTAPSVGQKRKAEQLTALSASLPHPALLDPQDIANGCFVFTDGSCHGNANVANQIYPAGWGFVAVRFKGDAILAVLRRLLSSSSSPSAAASTALIDRHVALNLLSNHFTVENCEIVAEMYGPVILDSSAVLASTRAVPSIASLRQFSLGATVTSNNTGELCAMGEAFLWMKDSYLHSGKPKCYFVMYDSEYAARSVLREYNGPKNRLLIDNVRQHFDEVNLIVAKDTSHGGVSFHHVKAHVGHYFNEHADRLANQGSRGMVCSCGRYSGLSSTSIEGVWKEGEIIAV